MSRQDRIFKTPKGHYWLCNDSKCLKTRDKWGKDNNPTNRKSKFVHCASPQGCHGVLCLDNDDIHPCDICGRYYCENCINNNITGRFASSESDLTGKYLEQHTENEFVCYECVPKMTENKSKCEEKTIIFKTPKGYDWVCNDPKCLAERDDWGEDGTELKHCSNPKPCHGAIWIEKFGWSCEICGKYYCDSCLDDDTIGRYIIEEDTFPKNF